jgi:hypothetical protein
MDRVALWCAWGQGDPIEQTVNDDRFEANDTRFLGWLF